MSAPVAHFRLAMVTPRFWPFMDDGSRHLLRLAEGLALAGNEIVVATPRWKRAWPERMNVGPIELRRLSGDGMGGLGTLRWMYALTGWLKEQPFDAVLVSGLKHEAYVALGTACNGQTMTIPLATDDCLTWQQTAALGRRTLARCQQAHLIVATGAGLTALLACAGYDAERICVIERSAEPRKHTSPIDRLAARSAIAAVNYDLATVDNAFVALAVGRLNEQHRFGDLVRAWRIVTARRSDARLWIVGDGPDRERLFRQIGDLDQRFRAFLPGTFECTEDLLAACNVLLVPGVHAVPPLVMQDALATGVPIVAADTIPPAMSVLPGPGQHTYPPGDFRALAQIVISLIEAPAPTTSRSSPGSVPDEAQAYLELIDRLRQNHQDRLGR